MRVCTSSELEVALVCAQAFIQVVVPDRAVIDTCLVWALPTQGKLSRQWQRMLKALGLDGSRQSVSFRSVAQGTVSCQGLTASLSLRNQGYVLCAHLPLVCRAQWPRQCFM